MPLGIAATQGMTYTNDWDKDISRLYQREEYAAQVRAEKERKTQFYAGLLKKGHVSNPRAEQELEGLYTGLNDQLAQLVTENPDLETNVNAMAKFQEISAKFIDNDIIRADKQVASEFEKLRQAVSNKELTPEEYESETKKYHDYIAGKPGDGQDPYVFVNFKKVDYNELVMDTIKSLGVEPGAEVFNPKTGYTDRVDAVPDLKIEESSRVRYSDPKVKLAVDAYYENFAKQNPNLSNKYFGPDAALNLYIDQVKAANNKQIAHGNMNMLYKNTLEGNGEVDVRSLNPMNSKIKQLTALGESKDKDGNPIEASMPSSVSDVHFTAIGGSANVQLSTNLGAITPTGSSVEFGANGVTFKKTGVGRWQTFGSVPYLEIIGEVIVPKEQNSEGADTSTITNKLKELGFVQNDSYSEGIDLNFEVKKVTGTKSSGSIFIPATLSIDGMTNWAKDQYTPTIAAKVAAENINNISVPTDLSNINNLNKFKQDVYSATKATFIRKVEKSEVGTKPWSEDRYIYARLNGKNVIIDITKDTQNIFDPDAIK